MTDIHFPAAQGVPGRFWGQAPQWWNAADPNYTTQLDDPRWRGAVNRSYDNGTGLEAAFRGVYHVDGGQTYLFASWQVYTDPDADGQADLVWLGLQRGGHGSGHPAYIVEINSPALISTHDAASTGGVNWYTVPDGGGTRTAVGGGTPELEARHWMVVPTGASNVYSWAIGVRIPLQTGGSDLDATGLNLGNTGDPFAFFYTIIVDHGLQDPMNPGAYIAVPYAYPRTGADLSGFHADPTFPSTDHWAAAQLGGSDGTGISLSGWDITANGGTNDIHAVPGATTTNHFLVRPKNNGLPMVAHDTLQATVRIANWGSQTPIDKAPPGQSDWVEIPFTGAAETYTGTGEPKNSNDMNSGDYGNCAFDWVIDPTTAQLWAGPTPTLAQHQCVFAQLREVGGTGYDFVNDSAYNNMNVLQTASPARSTAEISVKGRPAVRSKVPPKLYMFVQKTSAPRQLGKAELALEMARQRRLPSPLARALAIVRPSASTVAVTPRIAPISLPRPSIDVTHVTPNVAKFPTDFELPQLTAQNRAAVLARAAGVDFDIVAEQLPTFRYHAYYPTNTVIRTRPNRMVHLYDPQTSFGYYVLHKGLSYGWTHGVVQALQKAHLKVQRPLPTQVGSDRFMIDIAQHNEPIHIDTVVTPVLQQPKRGILTRAVTKPATTIMSRLRSLIRR